MSGSVRGLRSSRGMGSQSVRFGYRGRVCGNCSSASGRGLASEAHVRVWVVRKGARRRLLLVAAAAVVDGVVGA